MLVNPSDAFAGNPNGYQYAIPTYSLAGLDVIDVGCGDGQDFLLPQFKDAKLLCGVDVDAVAIRRGRMMYSRPILREAPAENLPFVEKSFDVYISRVSLPYTDIRKSVSEACRVLKRSGRIYLSMHDITHQWMFFKSDLKALSFFRVIDHLFVFLASGIFAFTGHVIPGIRGKRETFQTSYRMLSELHRAGFVLTGERIIQNHNPRTRHWIIEARRL